jgi:rhodanese-related sulfurtransferase/DNA-directed RNA polymerase subunit RPC12/RpoP
MKHFALLIFLMPLIANAQTASSEAKYVCTPCGNSCDSIAYDSPGSCPTCSMDFVEKSTVNFKNINFAEMCDRIKKNNNILLLDVRTNGEFTGENKEINSFGHIKNAININVSDLESRLSELEPYKNTEIIIYCSHSHRSPRAAYMMTNNGFKNVTNVIGGVSILESEFGANECVTDMFVT